MVMIVQHEMSPIIGVNGAYVSSLTGDTTDIAGQTSTGANSTTQAGTNANLPPYYALCYIIKHTATSGSGGVGIGSTSKIIQGNTEAEVVDTGSDGHFLSLQKAPKDFV